jgi:hypothetical protein
MRKTKRPTAMRSDFKKTDWWEATMIDFKRKSEKKN